MYAVDRIGMSRRGCMRNQGALRPPACVAAGEGGASVHVRAGVPLGDAYVALPVEGHAEPLQVVDAQLGTLDGPLHHARVAESVALLQRVRGVLVPAVCDVHGGQGRVDATGGDRGVRVDRGSLPDGEDVDASLGQLDRGRRPAPPVPTTSTALERRCPRAGTRASFVGGPRWPLPATTDERDDL